MTPSISNRTLLNSWLLHLLVGSAFLGINCTYFIAVRIMNKLFQLKSYQCCYKNTNIQRLLLKRIHFSCQKTSAISGKAEVKIVEVGPRDGLQNEKRIVPTDTKIAFIEGLAAHCGLLEIEATSFVSPKWVPQMADHEDVVKRLQRLPGVSYPVLVMNAKGLEKVVEAGCVREIAVFTAASESFSKRNANCTMDQSIQRTREMISTSTKLKIRVRGYISCAIGCPYDGSTNPSVVSKIAGQLLEAGCYEVSIADTIGVGGPASVNRLLDSVLSHILPEHLAVHFHDTYGQALTNVLTSLDRGIRTIDSSVAGLGGCPYALGASGNMATEDLVYMLNDMGVKTGVDLDSLIEVGNWICKELQRGNNSKVAVALSRKKKVCPVE